MSIRINVSIFPLVASMSVRKPGSQESQSIDLPRGANILYLQNMNDPTEISLLKKYSNKEQFTDEDYRAMFNLFLNNTPRINPSDRTLGSSLDKFGICLEEVDNKFQFNLISEYIPQIKVETWDCITLDLLKDSYTDIINCFDFGDIDIYLGAWKSESNVQKQSLLTSFRSAVMFTLVGFLFGDDRALYSDFNDYFEKELYKRIAFINGIWKHRKNDEEIKYIPVFDSFYNLKGTSPKDLIQIIHTILEDENIVQDERMMIKNRLIEGANEIHSNNDSESLSLEADLIKPVINYIIEIQSADENIVAAEALYNQVLYGASINRCYYSMMHALKALLEYKEKLSNWVPGILNVKESHKALEDKLVSLSSEQIIQNTFVADFKYVKQKRWIADYNIATFSEAECLKCINKAKDFIEEVKRISLK